MAFRHCSRIGCGGEAVAAIGMDRDHRVVHLVEIVGDDTPSAGDLCRRHADRLRAPLGWCLDDERTPRPPAPAPQEEQLPMDCPPATVQRLSGAQSARTSDISLLLEADTPLLGRALRRAQGDRAAVDRSLGGRAAS
jgi:Protein of unknown function (DUF3499)